MTTYEKAILEKLTKISENLASIADSLKELGDAAEGDSRVFQALGAAAFNPKKDGCWNCKHHTYGQTDEFVHLECDLDGTVVGNAFICENWEKMEAGG